MPIVTESRLPFTSNVDLIRWDGVPLSVDLPYGYLKRQTGFRSGERALAQQVRAAIGGRRDQTWKDTLRVIQGLEYEYNSRPDRQASVVNTRDYSSEGSYYSVQPWSTSAMWGTTEVFDSGVTALALDVYGPTTCPDLFPGDAKLSSDASRMMRSSVPAAPAFDLTRFIGELRDLPKSLFRGNYFPSTGKEYASAYLNQVFGLQPTGKDLAAIAHGVMQSTEIVKDFVSHQSRQVRRRRTIELGRSVFTTEYTPSGSGVHTHVIRDSHTHAFGRLTNHAPAAGRDNLRARISPFTVNYTVNARSELKQFATFEYFVPRPTGLLSRMDGYRKRAALVLGSGLSASAVYELSPWSWMLDWFIDIGSLLAYQEVVATNSVVATRSGWNHVVTTSVGAYMLPRHNRFHTIAGGTCSVTADSVVKKRRAGGPFDIIQPWSLSANQSAIVTALAVTRYSPF